MERYLSKPLAVLVGKTNVGKSTLFNRLTNKRFNITHSTPGATRDCIIKEADFFGHSIMVADSGGLETAQSKNPFKDLVKERVHDFVGQKASIVLFVVSAKDGFTAEDEEIAQYLYRVGKPVITVINKVDHQNHEPLTLDCVHHGFRDAVTVSAAQNLGLSELKKRIMAALKLAPKIGQSEERPLSLIVSEEDLRTDGDNKSVNVAVLGRPNSGKSTLVNALLNEDRVMVSELPGTTVDAVDTKLFYAGKEICLIDTAGIRRQRSIYQEVEKMAVARSLCALDRAQVAILLISAQEGISEQDQKIAGMIFDKKKACVIAINKWDEETEKNGSREKLLEDIEFHFSFLSYAPIVFMSAKYGRKIFEAIDRALMLAPRFQRRINTSKLNRSLERALEMHPPPVFMGRRLKLYFATQIDHSPPTFAISCSKPQGLHFSYKRYLANFFREDLGLREIPIRLIFRNKSSQEPFERNV
ncbi:MAG TPA: ribosome biogenesis GTPase Der [Myxococcota bacterium]|nr:ribosome biogenesis GTPase Der [Myxococcota bacterium]